MQDLVERADLGRPVTFELAKVVLADFARHRARRLDHVAERARPHGVGSQLIDHDVSPVLLDWIMAFPDAAQRGSVRSRAGVYLADIRKVGPGSAEQREERCTASGTRDSLR